jgi:hypothetical protein
MAWENGNGHSEDGDIVLDISALKIKMRQLQENHADHADILEKMAETDRVLSERLVAMEVRDEHHSEALSKLQKETSLQTKLLSGILLAVLGAVIKALFHV